MFRSYDLIVTSSEDELIRDARLDVDKARSKLKSIQQQLQRDREHAAAREKLLTSAENKLSAAIVAAGSATPAPAPILEPPRHTKSEALEHRREFKAAMRQRIRDVAASRDLFGEEIKPALTLKPHEIAKFTEVHGVNLEWLLEGRGRIFATDPIEIRTPMTGKEFVAVLSTLPQDEQEMIKASSDVGETQVKCRRRMLSR
ncbi:hypothetical protein [Bradyrhizobium sp. LA7.1]|uniref:hypothetical protein n=1 Tax=Bradyrhizobium sp. LA7.1 TaxID=3156324 RepID=UPI0033914065